MAIEDEFATVDLLLQSKAESRGVDAFALSVIKVERQMRRLCTFLVFQSDVFAEKDVQDLRHALTDHKGIFLWHFLDGWDDLCTVPLADLVGEQFHELTSQIDAATNHRNKIFHGQLTEESLSREELEAFVEDLRNWCSLLGAGALSELGYDGMDRTVKSGSFRKSTKTAIRGKLAKTFTSVEEYTTYLRALEGRKRERKHKPTPPHDCDG